jgi:hypothetical protein
MPAPIKGSADPMERTVHKPRDGDCQCAGCRAEGDGKDANGGGE